MTDQEQADVVRAEHPCQTPHADRLAREGISFNRTYCPTAHCCPSRATFFTGLFPSRHGIFNNISTPTALSRELAPGVSLFSEGLREAGYDLAFSGKWHVSDTENPGERGWRELRVTAGKGSFMHRTPAQWHDIAAAVEAQSATEAAATARSPGQIVRPGWGDFQLYQTVPARGPKGYEGLGDYQTVRAGIDALPELASGGAPWCLFIGPNGPHDPFVVPEPFVNRYNLDDIALPPSYTDSMADKPRIYQRMRRQYWNQLSEAEVRDSIRHYWAYCTMMDAMFGEVLEALEATGQAEDTLVLFLSDHGEYAGAHGLYCKGIPAFREAYQVPCVARWPAGIAEPGRVVTEMVSLADFAPTFLDLADAALRPEVPTGLSLSPFLRGEQPATWRNEIHTQMNGVELYYTQRSVTTDRHKYVYNGFDFDELYDLSADPNETVNLSDAPDMQEIKRDLVHRMWRFAQREKDERIFNPYATVAMAPWGPADAGFSVFP